MKCFNCGKDPFPFSVGDILEVFSTRKRVIVTAVGKKRFLFIDENSIKFNNPKEHVATKDGGNNLNPNKVGEYKNDQP